jgi:hypothetical protein
VRERISSAGHVVWLGVLWLWSGIGLGFGLALGLDLGTRGLDHLWADLAQWPSPLECSTRPAQELLTTEELDLAWSSCGSGLA